MGVLRQLPDRNIQWHTISAKQAITFVASNAISGLTHTEARKRLLLFGQNTLPKHKEMNALLRFLSQFQNVISVLLIFITIFCFIVGDIVSPLTVHYYFKLHYSISRQKLL